MISKSIRAAVFDFDDTLVATFESRSYSLIEAARDFGLILSQKQIREIWGKPFRDLVSTLIPTIDYARFYNHYRQVMLRNPVKVNPGVFEILKALVQKNVYVAIISSSSRQLIQQDLHSCHLAPYIHFVQGFEDSVYSKPDGRVWRPMLAHLSKLEINFEQCISIGDSVRDYLATIENQVMFVAVLTGFDTYDDFVSHNLEPKYILKTLDELQRLILSEVD